MSLLQLPPLHSLNFSTPFLHGSSPIYTTPFRPPSQFSPPSRIQPIRAMKSMQGKVVCATNDKTVAVQVVRLAPHPKYKRRIRKLKKYQAHDPENQFKVGDLVQLQKSRPISKTKTFIAVAVPPRSSKKKEASSEELGIPLESQQEPQPTD